MKTLYLDLISGISGDMFLGALVDVGVDFSRLERELSWLCVEGYHLHAARQSKCGISGIKFDVHLAGETAHAHDQDHKHDQEHESHEPAQPGQGHIHGHHQHGRNFKDIQALVEASPYSAWVKEKSIAVFRRIALAEGKIHGRAPEEVHFHEVGAIDSIVDIVGACLALEMLGRPRVLASHVQEGAGWIDCAHGRFPVPAPATLEILAARGITLTQCEEPHELVTPTGAALLSEFVEAFGPIAGLKPERIGYGLGTRDLQTRPNVLRVLLCVEEESDFDWETDRISVLETNLDDISPEILGHFVEKALAEGALDVYYTPIQMKKNRPGVLLSLLCPVEKADHFTALMLRETSAFGVRRTLWDRRKLKREFKSVVTPYGPVKIKLGWLNGEVVQMAPEYETCKQLAAEKGIPVKRVFEAAMRASQDV